MRNLRISSGEAGKINLEPISGKDRFHKDAEPDIMRNEAFVLSDAVIRGCYFNRDMTSSGLYFRGQPSFDSIFLYRNPLFVVCRAIFSKEGPRR